jgi:hypothetical protein
MKLALRICSLAALCLLGNLAYAQDYTAESVQESCAHWSKVHLSAKKEFKGNSQDVYQTGVCVGYFTGLMDGIDNTSGWGDGKADYMFHIERNSINSIWDVIRAFYTYVQNNPLAKGKPAWKILQIVLIDNHLAGFQRVSADTQQTVQ